MKIGIFIEPDLKLKKKILFWKKKFNKKTNKIFYLNHPPHMTLCTKSLKIDKFIKIKILTSLNNIISKEKSFKLKFNKSSIFKKDPVTKCDTIFFKCKKNNKLSNIQNKIILYLSKFKNIKKEKINFKKKIFNHNYKKYGYPFVGKQWKPHMTICSVENSDKTKKLINQFLSSKINFEIKIKKISIWHINFDSHKKIKNFDLI